MFGRQIAVFTFFDIGIEIRHLGTFFLLLLRTAAPWLWPAGTLLPPPVPCSAPDPAETFVCPLENPHQEYWEHWEHFEQELIHA